MAKTEVFKAPNNDGTGRSDYHVSVEGDSHSAVYGPFFTRREADAVAAQKERQPYWDTGEGHF